MPQRLYPKAVVSLYRAFDDAEWARIKIIHNSIELLAEEDVHKLKQRLELALSEYLLRVKGSHEGIPLAAVRDEIQQIGRLLAKFCEFVKDKSDYSEVDATEISGTELDAKLLLDQPRFKVDEESETWRLTSGAFSELQRTANSIIRSGDPTAPLVDVERFIFHAQLLRAASEYLKPLLTRKSGRPDDPAFDMFIVDVIETLEYCLQAKPNNEQMYDTIWQLSLIAKKEIKKRDWSITGVAVMGLARTAIESRVKRALEADELE